MKSLPEDDFTKINANASRNQFAAVKIAYIMRDSRTNIVMANCKRIGDSLVLLVEYEVIRPAIIMTGRMTIPKVRIYSDS